MPPDGCPHFTATYKDERTYKTVSVIIMCYYLTIQNYIYQLKSCTKAIKCPVFRFIV